MKGRWLRALLFSAFVIALIAGAAYAFDRWVLEHQGPWTITLEGKEYELLQPLYLGLLIGCPVLLYGLRYSLADLPWQQRIASVLLRTVFFALLAIGLARPVT